MTRRVRSHHARRRDDRSAAARPDRRPCPANPIRRVLRAVVHRDGPHRLPERRRGVAGRARARAVHRRRGGIPAQPLRHRRGGVGTAGSHRGPLPAGVGYPGAHPRGSALRRGLRAARPPAARLPARRQGVLRGVSVRHARAPRRLLRPRLHHPAVEPGTHRRARPQSRYRRGESVDAADGGRSGRRRARPSDRRTGLPRPSRPADGRRGRGQGGTLTVGHRDHRAGNDDRRGQRRGTRPTARSRARQHGLLRQHAELRVHLGRSRVRGHHRPHPREAEGR